MQGGQLGYTILYYILAAAFWTGHREPIIIKSLQSFRQLHWKDIANIVFMHCLRAHKENLA